MRQIIFLGLVVFVVTACNKVKIDSPTFDVNTNSLTYKVGDTVTFNFTGKADYIVFYSGEPGSRYAFKDRTTATGAVNQIQFSTAVGAGTQVNNLALLASSNYNGNSDTTSINNATWVNITSRAKLATSTTAIASGIVDVSDFQSTGNSLYIAFSYNSSTGTATSTARSWTVTNFTANNIYADGSLGVAAADIPTGSFTPISFKNDSLKWAVSNTSLVFPAGKIGYADKDWVVSKALALNKVASDQGLTIKNISATLNNYLYTYKTPGIYTVSFVAVNANINDKQQIVKELTITVTP